MMAHRIKRALTLAVFALAMAMPAAAQSRIKSMPGYDQWAEISPKIAGSVRSGAIAPTWAADSASFDYTLEGVRWRFEVATLKAGRVEDAPGEPALAGPAAQPAAAADLHPGHALVPAGDHVTGAQRERERLAAVPGGVELPPGRPRVADVLHRAGRAGDGLGAATARARDHGHRMVVRRAADDIQSQHDDRRELRRLCFACPSGHVAAPFVCFFIDV
jgi:hypothetical protein